MDYLFSEFDSKIREIVQEEVQKQLSLQAQTQKADTEETMTQKEVCQLLKITLTTLWRKRDKGEIPSIKVGRRVLFKKSDVLKYLK